MTNQVNILWLEGIFDEYTLLNFSACSPAVNFWHAGFVKSLKSIGCNVSLIGHACERLWPMGRLLIKPSHANIDSRFSGTVIGYLNLPFVRRKSQESAYLVKVKSYISKYGLPDIVFTFNNSPSTVAARYLQSKYGVPWVYIAGDGPVVDGASGYVYQNWEYFISPNAPGPKIHLDGGLPVLDTENLIVEKETNPHRALMYMGALTEHGGAVELVRAFCSIKAPDIELWLTGRGCTKEIEILASGDSRIKIYGFVSQEELHRLASRARVFANPRPSAFVPNKLNYPSKLLHYFAYGRPVLSTLTDGLSPDYMNVVIPIRDESKSGLANAIIESLSMDDDTYADWCNRVAKFKKSRNWNLQCDRLLKWLRDEVF